MKSFFEMSFEEWREFKGLIDSAKTKHLWQNEASTLFAKIKASDHYHDGVPCREFHNLSCNQELPS